MENKGYNGWSNYETWNVKLWMDNEQGSYEYWREQAEEAIKRTDESDDLDSRKDDAANELADMLKSEHEESLPELQGFAADLLSAAMSEVDWREIADSLVDDMIEEHPGLVKVEVDE